MNRNGQLEALITQLNQLIIDLRSDNHAIREELESVKKKAKEYQSYKNKEKEEEQVYSSKLQKANTYLSTKYKSSELRKSINDSINI